jgi:4-diphosphocytidyl-2-C-methyl-D-erythritol kinase
MPTEGFAPAKVNLALHVTGRRHDGYHLLDSIVCFADIGDRLRVAPAEALTLTVMGPNAAGVPTDETNSVLQAGGCFNTSRGAGIVLEKHLPHAAGLGGGSSDAAAALRALCTLWGEPLPGSDAVLALGADVPVCLAGQAARMTGIGEALAPVSLPEFPALLVNPGVAVATGAVFQALERHDNDGLTASPQTADRAAWLSYLEAARNDLEPAARQIAPVIGAVLAALHETDGVELVRMSGSGASCFALYQDERQASAAEAALCRAHPDWWCRATRLA